jgi:uncharacterized protein (TIGR02145 family)
MSAARVAVLAEVITEGCCHAPGATGVTFAAFNPCAGASYGSTYTLTDDRDGKQYKIKYMPDDHYWMVQDLKFGEKCETKTSMGNKTTAGNITANGIYYGDCYKYNCGQVDNGYIYNNEGVMNIGVNSSTYTCSGTSAGVGPNAPSTCRGICPEDWHVPTYEEAASLSKSLKDKPICDTFYNSIFSDCGFGGHPNCDNTGDNNSYDISISNGITHWWYYDGSENGWDGYDAYVRCTMNY